MKRAGPLFNARTDPWGVSVQSDDLSEKTGGQSTKASPKRVLILCDFAFRYIGTIRDHLAAFKKFSRNNICLADTWTAAKMDFDFDMFDVVVLHYSIVNSSAGFVPEAIAQRIREFSGYKVLFIQDEYRQVDRTIAAIAELGINVFYSVINEEAVERVYHHPSIRHVRRKVTLTGFVPEELNSRKVPNYEDRQVDVGYRARQLPAWLGRFAQEKWQIGARFREDAKKYGLVCDIEHEEGKRKYGESWISFLSNCKAVLGTESGVSIIDHSGELQAAVQAFEQTNPDSNFEEIHDRLLAGRDGEPIIRVISPRCFEAAALRTLMILYPGPYSGILEPWRHYVPLARDHSNMGEVVSILRDSARAKEIINAAYQEVALNERYSFRAMVEEFDRDLLENASVPSNRCSETRHWSRAAIADLELCIERHYRRHRRIKLKLRALVFPPIRWTIEKCVPERWRSSVVMALKSLAAWLDWQ